MVGRPKPKKLSAEELWNYALRVLSQRAYSARELQNKLARRASSPEDLTQALAKVREYGFSDDRRFSENFASARLQNEGFGRFRVLRDLRSKQVPQEIAEQAVNKAFDNIDEQELSAQFLERKYRGKDMRALFQDEKNVANAYRRLRLAGFSSSTSLSVIRRYRTDCPDLADEEEDAG
jgi:regulatory protein